MKHAISKIHSLCRVHLGKSANNERGMFALTTALALVAMFGFIALGIEAGRWYIVRAELSKAVDASSLLGARNISNPHLDDYFGVGAGQGLAELVKIVGEANFTPGYFGADAPTIAMVGQVVDGKVIVSGDTDVTNYAARSMETASTAGQYATTHVGSVGGAQKRDVEIMMVLDRSGSMSQEIGDLKVAAKSFVDYFEDTQNEDKVGLISYSTAVQVDEPLATNFVNDMKTKIDLMVASGWTNMEDAMDQADGPLGFTDQSGVPGDQRVQQFLVFFTDGKPTAFRSTYDPNTAPYRLFTRGSINKVNETNGQPDVVVAAYSDSNARLYDPFNGSQLPNLSGSYAKQYQTGDGLPSASSSCGYYTMKWWILQDPDYGKNYPGSPISGYGDEHCSIPISSMVQYVEDQSKQMALDHAQELKANGVKIYTIGLGSSLDAQLLADMSSGQAFTFLAPTSAELQELFQSIAKNIKLRLIQV